ncbi:hypothetical protein ACTXL1_06870 [Psychrobacter celer]|uniref:hypothetical protein n=1 Tax=Psychrobacter celer TaxID=306572 RepID=UPI003FD3EF5E
MGAVIMGLIAFLLLPVLLVYSLVRPAKLDIRTKNNPNGRWSRGKFSLGVLAAWIAAIAIGVATTPEQSTTIDVAAVAADAGLATDDYEVHDNGAIEVKAADDVAKVKESETVKKEDIKSPVDKTFGITPDEFGTLLSAEAEKVGLGDIAVGKFNVTEGAVNDVFIEKLSDAIAMNGTVDKNGELKGITFIMGQTDKGDTEIMNMMMMAGLSARAINPDQPKEQTAGALTEVVVEAMKQYGEKGEGKASKTVGDVKYSSIANGTIGLWAVIEPA